MHLASIELMPDPWNLQERLAALSAEGDKAPAAAAKASTGGPAYLQWRGNTYTAFGERLKGYIGQAAELSPQLEAAQQQGSSEEQLALLEKLIAAFSEAKGIVRHSLATSGGTPQPQPARHAQSTQRMCWQQFV